jgi:hypothetical protein
VNFMDFDRAHTIANITGPYAAVSHDGYSGSGARDQLSDAIATFPGGWRPARRQYPLEAKIYGGIKRRVELRRNVQGAM